MVAAANPLAVEAGARVLREGGSAADAMVAVQAVLGLVEPQSSGLGGGAFLVWYDAATGEITTLDGRETAPLAATPRHFQDEDGEPLEFMTAVVSGRSVGTPGTPRLMEEAHRRWGRANWRGLFDEAIALAEEGFTVSARMADSVEAAADRLAAFPATADYFCPAARRWPPARRSPTPTTPTRCARSRRGAARPSTPARSPPTSSPPPAPRRIRACSAMTDLARYEVVERPAVCFDYRDARGLRHGPALLGRGGHRADPRQAGAFRPAATWTRRMPRRGA
jgi:gamma-glutamyltranspeptidase / glutathione hydrolase